MQLLILKSVSSFCFPVLPKPYTENMDLVRVSLVADNKSLVQMA